MGLWDSPKEHDSFSLSTRILIRMGRANAGVAFHLHQLALGNHIGHRLGLTNIPPTVPVLQGRNGLARFSLKRFLNGMGLTETDHRQLVQYFPKKGANKSDANLLQASNSWQHILLPFYHADSDSLQWESFHRGDMDVRSFENAHGLDETNVWQLNIPTDKNSVLETSSSDALNIYIEALAINSIGVMAIALGSVQKALQKAKEYCSDRIQGGKPIKDHPAVALLVGNVEATCGTVHALISQFEKAPSTPQDLERVFEIRAMVHPMLCQAASDALQTFGGYGYMQDYGMEKIYRDNQHLKLSFGTPTDLKMFLGGMYE